MKISPLVSLAVSAIEKLDPQAFVPLKKHQGKTGRINIIDFDYTLGFIITDTTIKIINAEDNLTTPDLSISGKSINLLKLFLSKQSSPVSLFSKNHITLSGDIGLLGSLNKISQQIEIDWEAPLAHLIGDFAAFHIGKNLRSCLQWVNNTQRNRCQDLTLFLQEEKKILPTTHELNNFHDSVDALRISVEKLELRLNTTI